MKKTVLVLAISALAYSCNNGSGNSATGKDSVILGIEKQTVTDTVPAGCYSQIQGRDTASLQIQTKGDQITGALSYNIFEKDRNDGSIQLSQTGDIIRGWYLFKSEGVISVREVAWKISGEELWPATGEVQQTNDTTRFAQPDRLDFDKNRPFKKIPCII